MAAPATASAETKEVLEESKALVERSGKGAAKEEVVTYVPAARKVDPGLRVTGVERELFKWCVEGNYKKAKQISIDKNSPCDNRGNTAFIGAAQSGNLDILEWLLDKGHDPNVANYARKTPLMFAAEYGNADACEFILSCGVDVNEVDKFGNTALHYAAKNGHFRAAQILVSYDADVNIMNKDHCTPLYGASTVPVLGQDHTKTGHYDVLELLLESGAMGAPDLKL